MKLPATQFLQWLLSSDGAWENAPLPFMPRVFLQAAIDADATSPVYTVAAVVISFCIAALSGFLFFKTYRQRKKSAPRSLITYSLRPADGAQPEGVAFFSPTLFDTENVPSIFVAEENEDTRLFVVNTLRLNYRVLSVSDVSIAFDRITALMPDLVITGEQSDLASSLTASLPTSHIPALKISHSSYEMAGLYDDILESPFDARDLLLRVQSVLQKRKQWRHESEKQHWRGIDQDFLKRIYEVLELNYMSADFSAEKLSVELGLTRLQLFRKLKALINKTPASLIRVYRIHKAKEFMETGRFSLAEIALKCGFGNTGTLNKAFRQSLGTTPSDYVKKKNIKVGSLDRH